MNEKTKTLLGILAESKLVATFTGNDGDEKFDGKLPLGEFVAELTQERLQSLLEMTGKVMIHNKGKCRFKPAPNVVGVAEFFSVLEAVSGSGSRFKVTDEDRDYAKQAMKSYEMAPEQAVAKFASNPLNMGREFVPDFKWLSEHSRDRRAAAKSAGL